MLQSQSREIETPDYRNPGVVLRILVLSKTVQIGVLASQESTFSAIIHRMIAASPQFEVSVLIIILALIVVSPQLRAVSYQLAATLTLVIAGFCATAMHFVLSPFVPSIDGSDAIRTLLSALMLSSLLLMYFNWRTRFLTRADSESRLQSLQARIRPHFLFNSLNTVAALIRHDPPRAERVLMDMSDLFRAVLADSRMRVPLDEELHIGRAYLDIEQLRLGERLRVSCEIGDDVPLDIKVPSLILQPILENAVYHGIEASPDGGEIAIHVYRRGRRVSVEVCNTISHQSDAPLHRSHSALANITERLALFFDDEADLKISRTSSHFSARITVPIRDN
jgi:two-component system sensor histidine kinase AlgZ